LLPLGVVLPEKAGREATPLRAPVGAIWPLTPAGDTAAGHPWTLGQAQERQDRNDHDYHADDVENIHPHLRAE
jgi:hypothetical protein